MQISDVAALPALAANDAVTYEQLIASSKSEMMGDPANALRFAERAAKLASIATGPKKDGRTAESLWLRAEALSRLNRLSEARPAVDKALKVAEAAPVPDKKLHGDLLMTRAAIAGMGGDIQTALRDLIKAHGIFARVGEGRSQALALHDLGSIYAEAGDHERAARYYRESVQAFDRDPGLTIPLYNNLGTSYRQTGRPTDAIREFQKALALARADRSLVLQARILTNLASAQLEARQYAAARVTVDTGLRLTASSDSEGWRPFLWGVRAQIAHAEGRPGEAAEYLGRAFAGLDLRSTAMPFREFHETAYRVYVKLGDEAAALRHFEAFKRLDDEARSITSSASAALIGAQFDFAHQELRITKLQAERLKRDVELARSRERLNEWVVWSLAAALVVAALVAIGAAISLLSIRRSRNEVRLANDELSSTNAELEKALTAKTRFLATTSHEIRTPLNGILGMTQVMLHDRSLPSDQRDRVRIVHEAGTTMRALVDDILDVAKMETGQIVLEQDCLDLPGLAEEVGRLWASQAATKGLALSVNLSDCPQRVLGDGRRIRQIIFNLMSNAVKFTDKGSVTLTVGSEAGEIKIQVADTGIGIPEDQIAQVFKSFHQVDGATTRRYGGTGLGLSISRDLVEVMGGEIAVSSELGKGSTFTVRIPLRIPDAADDEESSGWPEQFAESSILVVDNNPLTRNVVQAALSKQVNSVVGVAGNDASRVIRDRHFDHIVVSCTAFDSPAALHTWILSSRNGAKGDRTAITVLCKAGGLEMLQELADYSWLQVIQRPVTARALLTAMEQLHAKYASLAGKPDVNRLAETV